jgi:non-canonical poly(A) RNA polymerase PAPD5/7
MKPSPNRLICRAPNRFVPSIALWQHFFGPIQHIQYQQRFSSTATEAAQDGASSENGIVPPQDASAPSQLQAEIGQAPSEWKIRRPTTVRGNWHSHKKDASIAKNNRQRVAAHTDSLSASQQLLAATTAAFNAAEDYEGVVVQPIAPLASVKEGHLPWCLSEEEMTMSGMDRYSTVSPKTGPKR